MQLLFDLDNLLGEVLLVPQRASGGEHLPDEGRHGAGGGWVGVKTDWQQWAAVEQSRMYFWASPAPAASQLNFPAPYFPLQGTCTDPHHCLLAQSPHLALPPKYKGKKWKKKTNKQKHGTMPLDKVSNIEWGRLNLLIFGKPLHLLIFVSTVID